MVLYYAYLTYPKTYINKNKKIFFDRPLTPVAFCFPKKSGKFSQGNISHIVFKHAALQIMYVNMLY